MDAREPVPAIPIIPVVPVIGALPEVPDRASVDELAAAVGAATRILAGDWAADLAVVVGTLAIVHPGVQHDGLLVENDRGARWYALEREVTTYTGSRGGDLAEHPDQRVMLGVILGDYHEPGRATACCVGRVVTGVALEAAGRVDAVIMPRCLDLGGLGRW